MLVKHKHKAKTGVKAQLMRNKAPVFNAIFKAIRQYPSLISATLGAFESGLNVLLFKSTDLFCLIFLPHRKRSVQR